MSTDCQPNKIWITFICYVEATVDNYLNILEVYILLVLNICRYMQISHSRDVYRVHIKLLIATHIVIYTLPVLLLLVQFFVGWADLDESYSTSCDANYTNSFSQTFNVIVAFFLPVSLNVLVIYASIRHIHLTSTLKRSQHHVSARDKYHRSLVIQFLCFYIIWFLLWSPNIIVYQFTSGLDGLTSLVRLLNFIEIALDPFIVGALDIRFYRAWKKRWMYLKNAILLKKPTASQVRPTTTNPHLFTTQSNRFHTSAL